MGVERLPNGGHLGTIPVVAKIGDEVKRLRLRRAMTQQELADAAGLGINTIIRIEGNKTQPHPPTVRKLATALGVDPSEIVKD